MTFKKKQNEQLKGSPAHPAGQTAKEILEEQLSESQRRMSTLLQNLPGISYSCLKDKYWTMLDISEGCKDLTGHEPADLIGNKVLDYKSLIHPDDRRHVTEEIENAVENQRAFTIEYRITDRNDVEKWVWEKGVATGIDAEGRQILEGFISDISARKNAEKALQESHERFLTVLDSIDATIHVIDIETHEILFMNKYMLQLYGEDLTGKPCWQAFKNRKEPCPFCNIPQLLEGYIDSENVKAWQDWHHVEGRCYLCYDRIIRWTDQRPVKIQIATDITELKKLEEDLRQAHKMEAIGTLAGGIAHEFNNILGIILGNAELAIDEIPEWSTAGEFLSEVRKASLRGKDVVKQLLSFSRKSIQNKKPTNMVKILKEALVLLRASFPATIQLNELIPATCPPVKADQTQINQILINLCNNAYQAMEEDGGILEITLEHIQLKQKRIFLDQKLDPGEYVRLGVSDTGPGIPESIQERIFDPFYTTKEVNKGSGMGLSVVHGIIKNHDGFIELDSSREQGTRIYCYFPVSELPPVEDDEEIDKSVGGQETVLFVDDEESLVKVCEHQLESMGYKVITKTDPLEALDYFKTHQQKIDLVISDMTMPGMTGDQLIGKMKEYKPELKSIICTGFSTKIREKEGEFAGATGYIQKPFDKRTLNQKIREIFDSRPANSRG